VIVIDASVAVRGLLFDGDASALLRRTDLHVPHLSDSEVVSALRRLDRQHKSAPGEAAAALRAWGSLGVRRHPALGLLSRIWELRDNLTAYDATYVALSEVLGCVLATVDGDLAGAPGLARRVLKVSS
jgi:predicted nucleic acid-binding protein